MINFSWDAHTQAMRQSQSVRDRWLRSIRSDSTSILVTGKHDTIVEVSRSGYFDIEFTDVESVIEHGSGLELFNAGLKIGEITVRSTDDFVIRAGRGTGKSYTALGTHPLPLTLEESTSFRVSARARASMLLTLIVDPKGFEYTTRIGSLAHVNWLRSDTMKPLTYFLEEPETLSHPDRLIVAFSAFSSPGDFTFNYRRSIATAHARALYILDDFGKQGAYYYSQSGNRAIESSVQTLIRSLCDRLSVPLEEAIFVGSSKGGSAALFHGTKLGVACVLVGAPQYFIGTYLQNPHSEVVEFMSSAVGDDPIADLNRIIPYALESTKAQHYPKVVTVVGERDPHLKDHVVPLYEKLAQTDLPHELLVFQKLPHAEIGELFAQFLEQNLPSVLNGEDNVVLPHSVHVRNDRTAQVILHRLSGVEFSFELWQRDQWLAASPFHPDWIGTWRKLDPGTYKARVAWRQVGDSAAHGFETQSFEIR